MTFRYPPPSGYRLPSQPFSKFGYDSDLWLPAQYGPAKGLMPAGIRGFLRSIATRASVPNNQFANTGSFTNWTTHFTRDNVNGLYLGWANTALVNPTGETASGTQTNEALIEYPFGSGNWSTVLWGTNNVSVAAPGTMPIGFVPVNMPSGAKFRVASKITGSVNVLYSDGTQKASDLGDAQQNGGTDMRNVVNNGAAITFPSLIAGYTNKRAALMIGDSRIAGFNQQANAGNNGNNGDYQIAFSPNYAGTRYGCVGMTSAGFSVNHAMALTLAQYHTDVLFNLGINDVIANTSLVTLQGLTNTNIAAFTALKLLVWLSTLQPANSSNNAWIDLAGQTPGAHDTVRLQQNALIRSAGYPTAAGYFEYANVVQQSPDSGVNASAWKFDGTPNKYTADGAHLTNFSTPLIGPLFFP